MSYKKTPFFRILIVFLILGLFCGCNKGLKRLGKNEPVDNSDSKSFFENEDFFENVSINKVKDKNVQENVDSQAISKSGSKTSDTKGFLDKERESEALLTKSRNIRTVDSYEKERPGSLPVIKNSSPVERQYNAYSTAGRRSQSLGVEDRIQGLVTDMAKPITGQNKLRISIVEFSNFHGEVTDFTRFLYEELVTSFSANPKFEVIGGIHTAHSPISEKDTGIDAIVTGSVMDMDDGVKVNARLMSRKTGLVITAVSTMLPKSKAMEVLMKEKHESLEMNTERGGLYSHFDELTRQIVNSFTQDKKYKIVLLEFTDLNGDVNKFCKFLFQELVTRLFLADAKRIEIIDNNVVNEFMEEHQLSLNELAYPEFSKKLADTLGVNCIVKGIITDLGNSIKLNVRIITAENGSLFGVAAIDMIKDEKLAKLLGENVKEKKIKYEIPGNERKGGSHEKPDSLLVDNSVFFQEDFSTYDNGQSLTEWGEGLIVMKGADLKNFLTSDVDEFSVARQNVQFPGEFSFEFEVKGDSKYWSSIRFRDEDGSEFQVSFRLLQNILSITMPGPKQVKTEIDVNNYNKITVIRKSKLYELHINGSLLLVGSYPKYKDFQSFEIHSAFKRFQFTSFIGNNLVGK